MHDLTLDPRLHDQLKITGLAIYVRWEVHISLVGRPISRPLTAVRCMEPEEGNDFLARRRNALHGRRCDKLVSRRKHHILVLSSHAYISCTVLLS